VNLSASRYSLLMGFTPYCHAQTGVMVKLVFRLGYLHKSVK
jgi:hypothetical protein